MALINGKGYYIWKIPSCEGGDPQAIAAVAEQIGLGHVVIKIADGVYDYNYDYNTHQDLIAPVCDALLAKGVRVWGWHYVYGDQPVQEANAAIRQVSRLPLDGYVINAEGEYKGKYEAAESFMNTLRATLPDTPMALSSYRYPNYHPTLPWTEFLSQCDINMPQVYWEQAHNPVDQLNSCVQQFQLIEPYRQIIPTGCAYSAGDWAPTPSEITAFLNRVRELNMPAANFWSWDFCRAYLPTIWQAIADYPWPVEQPPKDLAEILVETINERDITDILDLYHDNAVFVTSKKSIQGRAALNGWYAAYLTTLYPGSTFSIVSYSGSDISKKLTYNIQKPDSSIIEVQDTLGVQDGKIIYHYSSIQY